MKLEENMHRVLHAVQDTRNIVRSARTAATPPSHVVPPGVRAAASIDIAPGVLGSLVDTEGFADGGITDREFNHDGIPLLDSFYFQYTNEDHHLQTISINPDFSPGTMRLVFGDSNNDDPYFFHIVHRTVNDPRVRRFKRGLDIFRGSDFVTLDRPDGDFVFVLLGFHFAYQGDDHHMRELSLLEDGGQLLVSFADENFDDNVVWDVDYAYVPADMFTELGQSRVIRAHGASQAQIAAGPSVIRGFKLEFKPYFTSGNDHHVRDIGVFTLDDGRIQAFYEDENSDDGFDWTVRWGILNPTV
jgi:hypothetical protein